MSHASTTAHDATLSVERRSGFWEGYRKTLKPLDVEEPVDVWIHRPIAYLLTRALYPTSVSPNAVTLLSIVFGLVAGFALFSSFTGHLALAGAAIFLSAVFDCADGQLARMRGTSSALGRMLDGAADFVVSLSAVGGAAWVIWSKHHDSWWVGLIAFGLAAATAVTGSFHTGLYDHYKNLYLHFTSPSSGDVEDHVTARRRHERREPASALGARLAWPIYLFYLDSQASVVLGYDPETSARFAELPAYDERRARIFREHMAPLMRVWRNWFGFGSLVFGLAVSSALDILEYYMLFRLVVLNALFYGWLRAAQRRASRAAFDAMGLVTPERSEAEATTAVVA